ncbi:MAG: hypothetical protein AAGB05_06910 [Pseudomonadota bacterium]
MLSRLKVALGAALTVATLATPAISAPLNATFTIDIYNFDAGGNSNNTFADAQNLVGRTILDTITYEGTLDFRVATRNSPAGGTPSIQFFFDSAADQTGITSSLNGVDLSTVDLSSGDGSGTPSFRTTTILDIRATIPLSFGGDIVHDDGISVYDDGVLVTAVNSRQPTTERTTSFFFDGGDFRLIYAAANGDPSILEVAGPPPVIPLPPAGMLLIAGVGGLTLLTRRRKAT